MRIAMGAAGRYGLSSLAVVALTAAAAAWGGEGGGAAGAQPPGLPHRPATPEQVLAGRAVVIRQGCGDCHGGGGDPRSPVWLSGWRADTPPFEEFNVMGHKTRARNLTPDNATGLGRFSERQIFNAIRFGLRPGETPDVEITSIVPGRGNFPANPKYLAIPMPWPAFRHMPDEDIWAVAAYLKHGVRPVQNRVPDSEGPEDFWASMYTEEMIGTYPAPPFPTEREHAAP
jgi:mono/diheme cytochrome c family protein